MNDKGKSTLEVFRDARALLEDTHVVLKSGRHSASYVNKDALFADTTAMLTLCSVLAHEFETTEVDVVVAPAIGGTILSFLVAVMLGSAQGKRIFSAYAEKDGDKFVIRRGFDDIIADNPRVLVVEDVLTTGASLRKVVDAVRELDGVVTLAGALWNRGGVTKEMIGVQRLVSLSNIQFDSWSAEECPLCAQGVPVNINVGHGTAFLAARHHT